MCYFEIYLYMEIILYKDVNMYEIDLMFIYSIFVFLD